MMLMLSPAYSSQALSPVPNPQIPKTRGERDDHMSSSSFPLNYYDNYSRTWELDLGLTLDKKRHIKL